MTTISNTPNWDNFQDCLENPFGKVDPTQSIHADVPETDLNGLFLGTQRTDVR
ncbi:hypothetical protein ACVRW4_02310 [Streptococcus phocae subsp. phocae]